MTNERKEKFIEQQEELKRKRNVLREEANDIATGASDDDASQAARLRSIIAQITETDNQLDESFTEYAEELERAAIRNENFSSTMNDNSPNTINTAALNALIDECLDSRESPYEATQQQLPSNVTSQKVNSLRLISSQGNSSQGQGNSGNGPEENLRGLNLGGIQNLIDQRLRIRNQQSTNVHNEPPITNVNGTTGTNQTVNESTVDPLNEQVSIQKILQDSQTLNRQLINIEPCKPEAGCLNISKKIFNRWRDTFLSATGSLSDAEKVSLFLRKSGSDLMDVYDMCPETQTADKSVATSFTTMMARLENHFSSDRVKQMARMEFKGLCQLPSETSSEYLNRVNKFASNCSFKADEINGKIMNVIAMHATDSRVRAKASEIGENGKRYSAEFFQNFLLHYELHRRNERAQARIRQQGSAVQAVENLGPPKTGPAKYGFGLQRPAQYVQQGLGIQRRTCWRCGSPNHDQASCIHKDKQCYNCQAIGHMQSVCKTWSAKPKRQQSQPPKGGSNPKKARIAHVEISPQGDDEVGRDIEENTENE